jgi:hypothetical protein
MDLVDTYTQVSQSIVAIAVKMPPGSPQPWVPRILGTGFVVGEGLIATNDHVVHAAHALPRLPGEENEFPITANLFRLLPGYGMAQFPLPVLGAFVTSAFDPGGNWYGPPRPDVGFFLVKARALPCLKILADASSVREGTRIATAGFPMGMDALCAFGYPHQFTPTLQEGIVSAVLPFPCRQPHALMLNIMAQGGASGSPIFLPDAPHVVGVLYAGLHEEYRMEVQRLSVPYKVPTNFSYCVPGSLIQLALDRVLTKKELVQPDDSMTLDEILSMKPGMIVGTLPSPWPPGEHDQLDPRTPRPGE